MKLISNNKKEQSIKIFCDSNSERIELTKLLQQLRKVRLLEKTRDPIEIKNDTESHWNCGYCGCSYAYLSSANACCLEKLK